MINYLEEYIDEKGVVQKGMFKGWDTTTFDSLPVGHRTYAFMPHDKIYGNHSFDVTLTSQDVADSIKIENMFNFIVQHQASHELAKEAVDMIKSYAAEMVRDIKRKESSIGCKFREDMSAREKISHANIVLQTIGNPMSYDDAWMFKALPQEFWRTPFTRDNFISEYFTGLNEFAKEYTAPEEIVALRAIANEISGRIFGAVSDAMLDPKLGKTPYQLENSKKLIESYRDQIIKFDDKMNVAEKKAEGLIPKGDGGK